MSAVSFVGSFVLICLSAVAAVPAESSWTEDVVSYAGFQIWSAKPRDVKEREFLFKIRQDYGKKKCCW